MVPGPGASFGPRPAVVLLHAGVADSRMWELQRQALESRYAVLAPDLRGFGGWFRQTAQHLAERLPDAEAVSLDWAGHLPSLERPEETAALVAAHLDRVP